MSLKSPRLWGSDSRIGSAFLRAGLGYGGSCFPKDLAAFRALTARLGYNFALLDEISRINEEALDATLERIREALWNLEEKRITLLGLAFKAGTDDIRQSPALKLARRLLDAGAYVKGYDPTANENARAEVPAIEVFSDPFAAARGAHCVVVCTEWPEFAQLDLAMLKDSMTEPVLVDARNVFDPEIVSGAGFTYFPCGRPRTGH